MDSSEALSQDLIEEAVTLSIKKFNELGKTGKPKENEWVFLACIILDEVISSSNHHLEVVALGTGSKCLGESQLTLGGELIYDSHAEIIARRAFKLYMLEQIEFALNGEESIFEYQFPKCTFKKKIHFHLYCSWIPCGDASIFPKHVEMGSHMKRRRLNSEPNEDIHRTGANKCVEGVRCDPKEAEDIHRTGAKCVIGERCDPKEAGSKYHSVGSLRTKPGRGLPTTSHSCSDKLFKWTVLGIQGALGMPFIVCPIYLETVIIGLGSYNADAFERAMCARFDAAMPNVDVRPPFRVKTPTLYRSTKAFSYSRSEIRQHPSDTSLIWSKTRTHQYQHEVAVEGRRLGVAKKHALSPKSQVSICRANLGRKAVDILKLLICDHLLTSGSRLEKYEAGATLLSTLLRVDLSELSESNISKLVKERLQNMTYGELKNIALDYQTLWASLKEKVLINWTKKNDRLKSFKVFQ